MKTLFHSPPPGDLLVSASGKTATFVVGEKVTGSIGFCDSQFHRVGGAEVGADRKVIRVAHKPEGAGPDLVVHLQ